MPIHCSAEELKAYALIAIRPSFMEYLLTTSWSNGKDPVVEAFSIQSEQLELCSPQGVRIEGQGPLNAHFHKPDTSKRSLSGSLGQFKATNVPFPVHLVLTRLAYHDYQMWIDQRLVAIEEASVHQDVSLNDDKNICFFSSF